MDGPDWCGPVAEPMLAFRLPVPVLYDWPAMVLSLLALVFASAIALFVVSRKKMGLLGASACLRFQRPSALRIFAK